MKQIKWRTKTVHIDLETGEIIINENLYKYELTRTEKQSYVLNGHGTNEYTKLYRRSKQLDIFDTIIP